jgi:MFS family permease
MQTGTTSDTGSSTRWFILAVLFGARTVIAFQFQSVAAIGPVVVENLGIDYALLGTLVGLYLLPGVVVALPGGVLGQRYGDKQVVAAGLALMVVGGVLVAWGHTSTVVALGRVISGVGAVLLNILLAKMVTDWFAAREIVLAMAIFVSSWPIGIGLALVSVPALASVSGVSLALASAVLLSALAVVLVTVGYRSPHGLIQPPASLRISLSAREWYLSILSGTVWGLFNVGFIIVLVFGPSLLTARGVPLVEAGATVSIVTWSFLILMPFAGFLAQLVGSRDVVMMVAMLAMALTACLLPLGLSPLIVCALFGLVAGPPPGLIMALPGSVLRPENRSAGMGVYYTCYYAAMAGLVPVAGLLRDLTQSPSAPIYFGAGLLVVTVLTLAAFRMVERRPGLGLARVAV